MGSFALAAQLRMTAAGTTARLTVALPADVTVTAAALVPALLSLGQRILLDYRLTGHPLPEVDATAVERAENVPATATGFTLKVTNDLAAKHSSIVVDSDILLGNDGGILLIAATLFASADHLLETDDRPTERRAPAAGPSPRRRGRGRRGKR
ncbi:hypothetical protein ACT4S2_17555 [Kocuria turfanensis]|uniref:hypothetical protein n=1 Tax=Kocuria turfanensis TaxID=388357 RepID=UPI004036BE5A